MRGGRSFAEPKKVAIVEPDGVRFLADVMLGSLARWLRIMGYDTYYDNGIDDPELVELARVQGRVILSRDRRLLNRRAVEQSLLISSDSLDSQIQQVIHFVGRRPDPSLFLSRCLSCNSLLVRVSPLDIRDEVPPYVYQTQQRFQRCPDCHQVFWPGTHRSEMKERVRRILAPGGNPVSPLTFGETTACSNGRRGWQEPGTE